VKLSQSTSKKVKSGDDGDTTSGAEVDRGNGAADGSMLGVSHSAVNAPKSMCGKKSSFISIESSIVLIGCADEDDEDDDDDEDADAAFVVAAAAAAAASAAACTSATADTC
jgi:hypothetical protein